MNVILKSFYSASFIYFIVGMQISFAALPAFDDFFRNREFGPVETKESEHFRVSWTHPKDALIADAVLVYLEAARKTLAKDFEKAFWRDNKAPVEIFPNLESFSEVSGLSLSRFRATGTIALTLEQRLMILSPRNLPTGYSWAETVVHEYIHYLIREIAPQHIPIWLHEGVAQMYQGFPYSLAAQLKPAQWGLFEGRRRANQLLSLETLREPFPMRETPEEAELAYIQALLFADWLNKQCGVITLIVYMRDTKSEQKALEQCTGEEMAKLEARFIPAIMGEIQVPLDREVAFFARDFDAESTIESEGELAKKESQNWALLSSELFNQGRFRASGIQMKKALDSSPVKPPSWRRQLAIALEKTGKDEESLKVLKSAVEDYPHDASSWFLIASQKSKRNSLEEAWDALLQAFYVNPFMDGLEEKMEQLRQQKPELKNRFLLRDLRQ